MSWGSNNFRKRSYRQYRAYFVLRQWVVRRVGRVGVLIMSWSLVLAMFGLDTNLTVAYQAFALMLALLLVAWLTMRLGRTKFIAERVLPRFASAGSPVKYHLRFKNTGRFSLKEVELLEELADPRPTLEEFLTTPEPGEEKRNWFDRMQGFYRWQWLVEINQRAVVS
ncbi:MAG: conserved repeat protein, partial [Verrucomicrobia bacterium]|nr:conserved repeat protein [Verrucomicrobiota bacterium]